MKKTSGHIPEPYEEDEEIESYSLRRRYFRKKMSRKKPRRWRKG